MRRTCAATALLALCWLLPAAGEQVLLLDTTTENTLGWTRYPYGPQASTPGWVEESYTNFEKHINWRSYVVCDVAYHNVNNWLWTPFIERRNANRIYIEINYNCDCSLFPGNALSCKETFSLHTMSSMSRRVSSHLGSRELQVSGSYCRWRGRFNTDINTEIKKPGAGEPLPVYLCKGDGKWTLPSGSCKCRAGFEPDHENQVCNECSPGKFKSHTGDDACIPCPDYSESNSFASAECKCIPGFYRAKRDPKHAACTQPPSAPDNLTVVFADQFSISLAWQPPHKNGGRNDITYKVLCLNCGPNVEFRPAANSINTTRVTVSALEPVTEYKFQVFAENGVSDLTGEEPRKVEITAVTEASVVSVVSKLRILSIESDKLTLAWNPPPVDSTDPDDSIESYEVKYFPKDNLDKNTNATTKVTKESQATIIGLKRDTEYGFRVRAKTKRGWGEFSSILYARTGSVLETSFVGEEEGAQVPLVAGIMVTVVVISVAAIIVTVLFLRSRTDDDCDKKQPNDCSALNYRNGEVYTGPERPAKTSSNATTPLFAGTGSRTYIDPHTYEDPNQAVREFGEIDAMYHY
ncbi:Ephrin type-A receptor 4-A [Eumeta japonica]|uniref:Ephrin type-A receptor 4-A n=1 Tax=Eumeta variegata TaxID=151549 RepID=A0A4C2ACL1_EUMVA|nr:Ephrin type-A receptor 4-A [Eumeta japonica]